MGSRIAAEEREKTVRGGRRESAVTGLDDVMKCAPRGML